jgi:predicted nucleic acid-binding protein
MIRAFLDASVLFAAAQSQTGASREIVRRAIRGEIQLVGSRLAFEEARRNLQLKAPEAAEELDTFLDAVEFGMVRPTREEVLEAMEYTAAKDAPIVAAAVRARVDYLVSLDRQHLVGVPLVAERSGFKIVLPRELLRP